jgi:hypothetical protein
MLNVWQNPPILKTDPVIRKEPKMTKMTNEAVKMLRIVDLRSDTFSFEDLHNKKLSEVILTHLKDILFELLSMKR